MNSSADLYQQACAVIPGGVNSPVRAWHSVGGIPLHIESGSGSRITTVDGTELIDFCGSWGPLILGHAHPRVVAAVAKVAEKGLTFGATTPAEIKIARLLTDMIPYLDMVRLVNSGTEAAMTAIRLARGFTGRSKIVKFDGCYHGHSDSMLVSAGSGLLTGGIASSAGVSDATTREVLVAPYNDIEAVNELFAKHGHDIAAIIVEPVAGNMGLVKPEKGFLECLREITNSHQSLLVFDEVITGFRLAPTSYGAICGITPDLTCLGKIIGGGMPIGAVGGTKAIMEQLAPLGSVYQAGTLSGNPVAVAAGIETLEILRETKPYDEIQKKAQAIGAGLSSNGLHCCKLGGIFTFFFSKNPVSNLTDAKLCDTKKYAEFFHFMISKGFYLPPSQFEVAFVSAAHSDHEISLFVNATKDFQTPV